MLKLFLYAFFIAFITLLVVIYFTHKYHLFIDNNEEDKPQNFHTNSTPRAGGIGILFGLVPLAFIPLGLEFIPSILFAFLSGIFEDFHNSLSPKLRLLLQFIAAFMGVWLTDAVVTYLGVGITLPYWLGAVFTLFAIVGMMNAINIIDGFNGLASGVILFILISFAVISYEQNNHDIFSMVTVVFGATFGFFILNFPKGKIFLGDGGAYMLGFIVAMIGIFLASKYESVSPWYVLAIFIYPVWEVLFSIIRKLSIGLSPMQPDSYHLHMLIYRQITKNNPLTSVFIWVSILPSMLLSTYYANSSIYNIFIAFGFICCYLILYYYLYKKDTQHSKNP
ncbi:MAG: undecaprenyl/decaprenyl-phosphate alpha-N-acetylglucosaminyl 1-phosphate transferase [Sulfurovum sp.]|nr:MAG: undecaprenyl/decaprenyl-phosphate alpha-N-acetylglucosaminyl 1-phosphate transferase [Sulfurovum sp.]